MRKSEAISIVDDILGELQSHAEFREWWESLDTWSEQYEIKQKLIKVVLDE